jgi:predicted phage tail protein
MIRIIPVGELAQFPPVELEVDSIPQAMSALQNIYGAKFIKEYMDLGVKHILKMKDKEEFIAVDQQILGINLSGFDTYYLIPEFEGEISAAAVYGIITGVALAAGATAPVWAVALALVINIAISVALSMIVQLIVPTPEFSGDPAEAQTKRSSLFNGAVNVWNQGGPVPLVFGRPFCGGVVISAGLYTEEVSV